MKSLELGHEFPSFSYELTPANVANYEKAVGIHSPATNLVLPSAIAAYAMKAMSQSVPLPPGSIHTSQELQFFKSVAVGSHINCQTRIVQRTRRINLNIIVIEINAFDQNQERVLSGKTTIILGDS